MNGEKPFKYLAYIYLHFVDGDRINISAIDGRFVQSLDLDSGLHSKNRPYQQFHLYVNNFSLQSVFIDILDAPGAIRMYHNVTCVQPFSLLYLYFFNIVLIQCQYSRTAGNSLGPCMLEVRPVKGLLGNRFTSFPCNSHATPRKR